MKIGWGAGVTGIGKNSQKQIIIDELVAGKQSVSSNSCDTHAEGIPLKPQLTPIISHFEISISFFLYNIVTYVYRKIKSGGQS